MSEWVLIVLGVFALTVMIAFGLMVAAYLSNVAKEQDE